MKKIKIDRYLVQEEGRAYEVLKFPFIRHMWAYEDWPENCMAVDGCKEAFAWLRYAFAILADYPDKIIYFPCKQEGIGQYYNNNYHLVLLRSGLQFKRHLWPKIKRKLDKRHYAGKFVLSYDRKKLDDYYRKGLWKKCSQEESQKQRRKVLPLEELGFRAYNRRLEEIRGDTMFVVLDRVLWYKWHYQTAKDLDDYRSGKCNFICSSIGWIVSDGDIQDMYQEAEEEQKKEDSHE